MLVTHVEEQHVKNVMRNSFYRWFFFTYTKHLDLKNIIITKETRKVVKEKNLKIPRVLDVGFGFGQRIFYLLSDYPKCGVLGIDVSDKAVTYANKYFSQKKHPNIYCMKKDVINIDDTDSFDIAYVVKALNYIEQDDIALKKIYDSLKPGGTLLLLNSYSSDMNQEKSFDRVYSLTRVRDGYTLESLEEKVKNAGFNSIDSRFIYGKTGNFVWKTIIEFPIKSIRKTKLLIPLLPFYMIIVAPFAYLLNLYELYIGHIKGRGIFIKAIK